MDESTDNFPEAWRSIVEANSGDVRTVDPPTSDDTGADPGSWFQIYSNFATRGFVRGLASPGETSTRFGVQLAFPTNRPTDDVLDTLTDAFRDEVGGEWNPAAHQPEWMIAGNYPDAPKDVPLGRWIELLEDLGRIAETGDISDVSWLASRLDDEGESAETTGERHPRPSSSTSSESVEREGGADRPSRGASADVFESIGKNSASGPSGAISNVGLVGWEVLEQNDGVEGRLQLDHTLPPSDRETLVRELSHALRSRYDIAARPLPPEDTSSPDGWLRLRAEPTESGLTRRESPAQIRSDMESYFERLTRFDDLGVKLAAVLGLEDRSAQDSEPSRSRPDRKRRNDQRDQVERQKRGRGRHEERAGDTDSQADARSPANDRGGRPSASSTPTRDNESSVVLGVDDGDSPSPSPPAPESGLEPGNYRDPRLMREDATTSLVDIVLRHPGYAEEKMGHNLSILLSIDFPDAMDLVQQAPSIIAWGVGQERALKFKRFIEDAGGKVVLVEPDSLAD